MFSYILCVLFFLGVSVPSVFAQTAKTKPHRWEFYLKDLTQASHNIQYSNYEKVVYRKICPYMQELSLMESKQKVLPNTRQKILEQVIKIYGKAFDFSSEHYLMYCIYNSYRSKKLPTEILKITQEVLSIEKQDKFADMWELCDQEEREGNGDNPESFRDQYKGASSNLLPARDYKKLSPTQRKKYIQSAKKAFVLLEIGIKKELFAKQENREKFLLFDFFIETSYAILFGADTCLIGGHKRELVYDEKAKRYLCPTFGKDCSGSEGTSFQCGALFNNKCIARIPSQTISQRCYNASKNESISQEDYDKYKTAFDRTAEYCKGDNAQRASCIYFNKRMEKLNRSTLNTIPSEPTQAPDSPSPLVSPSPTSQSQIEEAKTSAQAICMEPECLNQRDPGVQEQVQTLQKLVESVKPEDDEFIQYFTGTVYNNSTCECPGNDACLKGCLSHTKMKETESQFPPVSKCKGKKPIAQSTRRCMRGVTNAIMNVVHKQLSIHCPEDKSNLGGWDGYNRCIAEYKNRDNDPEWAKDNPINFCQHGFAFKHALCALNLDGESEKDFDKIENSQVRETCKTDNTKHNRHLYTFPVKHRTSDGREEYKQVPLFKKVPLEGSDFQNDPNSIPEGAIVVMKSQNASGHVKIKTGKNECGPADGPKQACFCSDFCRSRENGYEGKEVLAVFQWNPEIMEYAKKER